MSNWDNMSVRALSVRQRPASGVVGTPRPHVPPHWTPPNGLYCGVDSDEDSGIGHSNNGCLGGDRVRSTSSAEAEIPSLEFIRWSRPLKPVWPLISAAGRGVHAHPVVDRLAQRATQCTNTLVSSHSLVCGQPIVTPPMLDSSGSTDEVFHSFCAYLGGPASCTNAGHFQWRPSSKFIHSRGRLHPVCVTSKNWSQTGRKIEGSSCDGSNSCSHSRRSIANIGDRSNDNRARKVWSYSGESSRYANIYENMHCMSIEPREPMMLSVRARPLAPFVNEQNGQLGSTSAMISCPPSTTTWRANDCSASSSSVRLLQRAQSSTSLASLITVDSDLIRVHAIPAAVISVDEDSHHESRFSHKSSNNGYYESIDRHTNVRACNSASPIRLPKPPSLTHSSPKDSSSIVDRDDLSAVGRRVVEVQYAQVQKPKRLSKKSSNGFDRVNFGGVGSQPVSTPDESEPPLPPRNYRRNSVRNNVRGRGGAARARAGGGSGSRSSLAEKVQDFTRSAKQALRRALSLDALHGRPTVLDRKMTSTSVDPRWDNAGDENGGEDEWVDKEWRARRRPVAVNQRSLNNQRTCRTPAAVKAKDAARLKPSVTLC